MSDRSVTAAAGAVRVLVTRTGGFAGVSRSWRLEEADLDDEGAARLRALVAAAACEQVEPAPPRPDGFEVELVLERGDEHWSVRLPERSATGPVRELLDLVRGGSPGGAGGRRDGSASPR